MESTISGFTVEKKKDPKDRTFNDLTYEDVYWASKIANPLVRHLSYLEREREREGEGEGEGERRGRGRGRGSDSHYVHLSIQFSGEELSELKEGAWENPAFENTDQLMDER